MILVAAPEGHDIGESAVSSQGFDDIDLDAILENQPAKPQHPPRIKTPKPQRPTSGQVAAPSAALQPGEDWTNPATKKKQKAILIAMASLVGLLILSSVGLFVFFSDGSETSVAKGGGIESPFETPLTAPESEPEPKSDEPKVSDPVKEEPKPSTSPEVPGGVDPISPATVPELPPSIPGLELPSDPPDIDDPLDVNDPPRERELDTRSDAAVLRSILAAAGTSMIGLRNAASRVREDFSIGTPKYFFEKVDETIDFTRRKDQKLLGVSYKQQSLQAAMYELTSISGLRLTINAPELSAADQSIDPEVTLTLENESTGSVVREIAKSVGLVATETDQGFVLSRSQGDTPVSQSIKVAAIVENQNDGEALVELVQQMVWPGTWQGGPANGLGQCQFANSSLKLKHVPLAINEVQRLVKGLQAALQNNVDGSELLQPVAWIDRGEFATPFAPQNSVRTSVGEYFRSFKKDYGIQIMADWHTLGERGWTSDSLAAGWIKEATVGDTIRETARAINAGIYVVDKQTVWLTSPEVANQIFLLKLYPLKSIANGKLDEGNLREILLESLGEQAFGSGVSLSFQQLNQQQILVLRAPQTLHRQVESVLKELQ